MNRIIFDNLIELIEYLKRDCGSIKKKSAYKVLINNEEKYVFAGNADAAIAAVARKSGFKVEIVTLSELLVGLA